LSEGINPEVMRSSTKSRNGIFVAERYWADWGGIVSSLRWRLPEEKPPPPDDELDEELVDEQALVVKEVIEPYEVPVTLVA
jgi:hypothetical protein